MESGFDDEGFDKERIGFEGGNGESWGKGENEDVPGRGLDGLLPIFAILGTKKARAIHCVANKEGLLGGSWEWVMEEVCCVIVILCQLRSFLVLRS